jgi:hypothetical protein
MSQKLLERFSLPMFAVGSISLLASLLIATSPFASAASKVQTQVPASQTVELHYLIADDGNDYCGMRNSYEPILATNYGTTTKVKLAQPQGLFDSVSLRECIVTLKVLK